MARNNQDASGVSFTAEILFNGKPYTDPLFLVSSEKEFISALSERLPKGRYQGLSKRLNSILSSRYFSTKIRRATGEQAMERLLYLLDCETELQHYRCVSAKITAMRALYYTCLDTEPADSSDIETVFQLLYQAARYYGSAKSNIESLWSFARSQKLIAIPEIAKKRDQSINNSLHKLKVFEDIGLIYHGFVDLNAEKTKQFEYVFRQHHTEKYRQSCVRFWNNKDFSSELKELFWDYCRKLPDSEIKQILQKRNVRALKDLILDSLDEHLQYSLEGSKPAICTKNGTVKWMAKTLETAEYLCLYTDLIKNKKYRVCPMCGSIFEVDPRYHTKIYCSAHTPSQIQYFNRKRNKQQSKE